MKLLLAFAALPAALATLNGHCAGHYDDAMCICVQESTCNSYNGQVVRGAPGDYPCPSDPNGVVGCRISPCKGADIVTRCYWSQACLPEDVSSSKYSTETIDVRDSNDLPSPRLSWRFGFRLLQHLMDLLLAVDENVKNISITLCIYIVYKSESNVAIIWLCAILCLMWVGCLSSRSPIMNFGIS